MQTPVSVSSLYICSLPNGPNHKLIQCAMSLNIETLTLFIPLAIRDTVFKVSLATSWSFSLHERSADQLLCYYCLIGELWRSAMRHNGTLFSLIVSLENWTWGHPERSDVIFSVIRRLFCVDAEHPTSPVLIKETEPSILLNAIWIFLLHDATEQHFYAHAVLIKKTDMSRL